MLGTLIGQQSNSLRLRATVGVKSAVSWPRHLVFPLLAYAEPHGMETVFGRLRQARAM